MESIEVEAVEDRTRPEGGHAVILVHGISSAKLARRFRLRPVESEGLSSGARAFFDQDHVPLGIAATADGLALSVGPEIADNPVLVPGALVEITLPDADAHGELLWPTVAPHVRPKRRNIMTRRVSEPPMRMQARVSIVAPETESYEGGSDPRRNEPPTPGPLPTSVKEIEPEREPPALPPTPRAAQSQGEDVPSADASSAIESGKHEVRPRRQFTIRNAPSRAVPPEPVPPAMSEEATSAAEMRQRFPPPSPSDAHPRPRPAPAVQPPQAPAATAPVRELPASTSAPARRMSASTVAALAVAVIVGGQLLALRTLDLKVVKREAAAARNPTPAPAPIPTPAKAEVQQGAAASPGIYEVLAAGPVSPRGVAAGDVSPARALQLAHVLLHGPEAGRDPEEGLYWLKRYVRATAGPEHARVALTQLGSAYAQPSRGSPDFARAMVAWELAGALGDPVAMCFLGAMHDMGLGVPVERAKAEAWFARAAAGGGRCASGPAQTGAGGRGGR